MPSVYKSRHLGLALILLNKLGITCSPSDPKELAKAIYDLSLISRSKREEMGKNARLMAENIYSRKKVNNNYDSLIKKVAKRFKFSL